MDNEQALIYFQNKVRSSLENLKNLNQKIERNYCLICSIMQNIERKHKMDLITQSEYYKIIEELGEIKIMDKLRFEIYKKFSYEQLLFKIHHLEKKVLDCVSKYGTYYLNDMYNFNEEQKDETFKCYIDLFNSFFISFDSKLVFGEITIEKYLKNNKFENNNLPFVKDLDDVLLMKNLLIKVDGARIYIPIKKNKLLVVNGIFKNDPLNLSRNNQILIKKKNIIMKDLEYLNVPNNFKYLFMEQLSLKHFLILSSREICNLIKNNYKELLSFKNKSLSILVKDFTKSNDERQRKILTLFLMGDEEMKFNASIIYDLISNPSYLLNKQSSANLIYDSLHYKIKKELKKIITKNKEIKQYSINDIDYELRINSLKCSENIKAKAFEKFKEISGTKDSSSKAQQYLDNLLKIPFGTYKEEKILIYFKNFKVELQNFIELFTKKLIDINHNVIYNVDIDQSKYIVTLIANLFTNYNNLIYNKDSSYNIYDLFIKDCYDVYLKLLLFLYSNNIILDNVDIMELIEKTRDFEEIESIVNNNIIEDLYLNDKFEFKNKANEKDELKPIQLQKTPSKDFIDQCMKKINYYKDIKDSLKHMNALTDNNIELLKDKINELEKSLTYFLDEDENNSENNLMKLIESSDDENSSDEGDEDSNEIFINFITNICKNLNDLIESWNNYKKNKVEYINKCSEIMNNSVHGHNDAKKSILRLIGQWMNGSNQGSCIGLCGPPGIGKTTLCKNGIAECLVDQNGNKRPFSFIALGGAHNGSLLEGHLYTYLGSTWGKIVDILIETQCMNPIIYIDELDKISNTEHGREIIGILTHLTDRAQNDTFEDKYFAGIKLDLSKALFIFSYNDSNSIDRILKDRITEIKIKPLTKIDKLIITNEYVMPDIYKNVGFKKDEIIMPKKLISEIIDNYTYEPGVRKLNEILFDTIREINLKKIMENDLDLPFTINKEFIDNLLADRPCIEHKKIASKPFIGMINGMYASSNYLGGITIIQVMKVASDRKLGLEKLTGNQGDVMKESMNCALTVVWNLLPEEIKIKINENKNTLGGTGLHIHCPDTSTPKDGPSAGIAITCAILSCLMEIPILNTVSVTGEIDLLGNVHKIGGVSEKVNGSIKAGVKTILLPSENRFDYEQYLKHKNDDIKILEDKFNINKSYDDLLKLKDLEDNDVEVHFMETIYDAIPVVFGKNILIHNSSPIV